MSLYNNIFLFILSITLSIQPSFYIIIRLTILYFCFLPRIRIKLIELIAKLMLAIKVDKNVIIEIGL